MYVEKRKDKLSVKYYLVHSYRENGVVRKIRRYLGRNLSKDDLESKKKSVEKIMRELISEFDTEIFSFKLSLKQVRALNNYGKKN